MRTELPIVAFICAVLVLIPLPWHWRARNTATLSIIFWLTVCNITRGINAIVWGGNTVVKYRVWGDITTKLIIGAYIALPASMMCVCRYLAQVASPRSTIPDSSDKRRRVIFELLMCVGLPIIGMALHYVVQGHRFDIFEDFGPIPAIYVSVAALFLVYLPPLVLSLGTLVYAGIALRWFVYRRAQFQDVMHSSQSGLTADHYLRLIALSITEMVYMTAMSVFILYVNIQEYGLLPWVNWEYVHAEWLNIYQYPRVLVPQDSWNDTLAVWYIIPLTSIIFFAFFGIGREANEEYGKHFRWIQTHVFRVKPKATPVLPVSARGGVNVNTANLRFNLPAIVKFQSNTTVSGQETNTAVSGQEKPDDFLTSTHTTTTATSRLSSSPDDQNKVTLSSEVHA